MSMENSFKPSLRLKVLIGLAVCLMLVSLYFFISALTQSSDTRTGAASMQSKQNADLDDKAIQAKIAEYENKIAGIESELALKESKIDELQALNVQYDEASLCEDSTKAYQACSEGLSSKESQLLLAKQTIESLRNQISATRQNTEALAQIESEQANTQDNETHQALAALSEENASLLSRLSLLETELETPQEVILDTAAIDLLQTQLVAAEQENTRLLTLVNELQLAKESSQEEADESAPPSNVLQHSRFEALPSFCETQFAENQICLSSLEIGLTFNFNPNGFISLRLIDPNGDTVDRKSVAGRTVNNITFEFDTDKPTLKGEYTLEIKIDDVFNNYRATERFSI